MSHPISKTSARSPQSPRREAFFLNRELSWLAFNQRVLGQARDSRHPLLERVHFLSIVSSNLDEFFQIRVAGLMQQMDSGMTEPGPDGLSPEAQLREIHTSVSALVADQYRCWHESLLPALAAKGIGFATGRDLAPAELKWVQAYFRDQVYPVLTPLALWRASQWLSWVSELVGELGAEQLPLGQYCKAPLLQHQRA